MSTWRLKLFRALKNGELSMVQRLTKEYPACIHEPFTKQMQAWELEWDSLRWFEFLEATALYIAASYNQKTIVEWLLENGVDRNAKGYCNQTALDVVGQCRRDQNVSLEIEGLLKQPVQAPRSPPAPRFEVKIVYENIVKKVMTRVESSGSEQTSRMVPKRVTQTVPRCKVILDWECFWLSPNVIYELCVFKPNPKAKARSPSNRRDSEWDVESIQKSFRTLTGLMPGSSLEVRVRAQNEAGWSAYSDAVQISLPEVKSEASNYTLGSDTIDSRNLDESDSSIFKPTSSNLKSTGAYPILDVSI
mmetsp:Transcript_35734/g.45465  ORF Transcript_35734/g.45465 Transcript_35734/m.45465 type:complete len:304 (+) Transcript_35734:240-1151(+)|eukprot:CAMPEP_0117753048 /NCGR_PEP_ID=MMETSP0947-20121206/11988_1 /TAXON_ID=44440 /ORGANISM="Chattonella subsalsa, Strain CCMP2191" /LENGTH=303 /DNA_ID=CAMNT_0005571845 /DNA_START=411 /DNA_END=1322 /DNA_ORIENTATION=-